MEVLNDSVLTKVSCSHYSLSVEKKTHRMNDGRKFPLRSSTVIPMEPEAQAQLRQNMSCSVSKPSRFQGTLNLRDI